MNFKTIFWFFYFVILEFQNFTIGQDECFVIEEKTSDLRPCIFPFVYAATTYNKCTNIKEPDGKFWCSTKVDTNGNHVKSYWGHCNQNCSNAPNEDQRAKVAYNSLTVQCGRQYPQYDTDFVAGSFDDNEKNPVGYWPWMASLGFYDESNKWKHQCGATLVTERHFLTAAHCAKNELKIRIGDTNHASARDDKNAVDLDIYNLTIHPKYNAPISYYDVAILETSPVTFSKFISPICLPQLPSDDITKYDNYFVDLTGWGQASLYGKTSDKLKRVSLKIHPLRFCNRTHSMQTTENIRGKIVEKLPRLFQNDILCAGATVGTQGSCKGDSGGPLMYQDSLTDQWIQIATVQGAIRDCGDLEYPGLYIRIDNPDIFSFIKSVLYFNFKVIEYENNSNGFMKYEGETQNDEPFGKGTMLYTTGTKYEGQWIAGKRNGNGTYIWKDGRTYVGEWKNDLRNGFGNETYTEGDSYEGEWKDGERSGNGTWFGVDGTKYVGEWKNNSINGFGKETYPDGSSYEGEWKDGKISGNGTYIWADGSKHVGEYKNSLPNGFGKQTYTSGDSYEGEWKDDKKSGNGTYIWADGGKYVGEFKNGLRHGVGIEYSTNGTIVKQGTWNEDVFIN